MDECIIHRITKLSFGIQSIDADVRHSIRMPRSLRKVEEICDHVAGEIPIVNADFVTGLPGQTLALVNADLRYALDHGVINALSTYLLTPGAAPSLIADVASGWAPQVPSHKEQALMRLHSYVTLQQAGWVRRGTNTYIDRADVGTEILDFIPGNECIRAAHFDAFLIAAGAQAIGYVPGVRFENIVNLHTWREAVRSGEFGFNLKKSAIGPQRDMSLWTFPLFYQGLSKKILDVMLADGDVSDVQMATLQDLIDEGLIIEGPGDYKLSILGEVFMGHIVRLLKKEQDRRVLDDYIEEGFRIGEAIQAGLIGRDNAANDRQAVVERL